MAPAHTLSSLQVMEAEVAVAVVTIVVEMIIKVVTTEAAVDTIVVVMIIKVVTTEEVVDTAVAEVIITVVMMIEEVVDIVRGRNDYNDNNSGGGGGGDDNRLETQRDTIFIQNLPRGVTVEELKDVFSQIGIIKVKSYSL